MRLNASKVKKISEEKALLLESSKRLLEERASC